MKTLNVVFVLAALSVSSVSLRAAEEACCDGAACAADAAPAEVVRGGGKSSLAHSQARVAKAEADKADEQRKAQHAEEKARKVAAGEKPAVAATPVVVEPVKMPAAGGGKSSRAHARAKAVKDAADQAAAQE